MSHYMGFHGRFGRRIFKLLLILAVVLAAIYLIRRHNMRKAGVQPKPFADDLRDIVGQMSGRLDRGDFAGMFDVALGRTHGPVQPV